MRVDLARKHGMWLVVALAAIAVYANSMGNGFAWDDQFIIKSNARVHQLADQSQIWLTPYWQSYGAELGLYRPFAMFVYALEWAAGGGAPWLFHATNVFLHALASALAFFLLRVLAGSGAAALIGGLLFAVHPVRVEAVANGVGQAELIAGSATLAACLIYATRPSGASTGWGRRIMLVVLYAVAMLTKESAIVLPALLVALDVAQRRVVLTRVALVQYLRATALPLFLLAATAIAYLSLRVEVLGSVGGVNAAPGLPFLRSEYRVHNALRSWPEYVRLLFFPVDLAADYSPAVILPVNSITPMVLLGAILLGGTVLLALLTPVVPGAGLPAAWFLIAVLPASNLLVPIGVVVAERLLYTPAFAVSLMASFAWARLQGRRAQTHSRGLMRTVYAFACVVLLALAARTFVRNPDWKDSVTVFKSIVRDNPESYRGLAMMGAIVTAQGKSDYAMSFFELAYRIWPDDAQLATDMAYQHITKGEYHRALALMERAHGNADWFDRIQVLLAQAAIGAGEYERALQAVIRADHLGTSHRLTFPLYAHAYEGLGRIPAAVGAWRATVRELGGHPAAWSLLARALAKLGDERDALAAADSAHARAEPSDTVTRRIVTELRTAVLAGCYEPSRASDSSCGNPLEMWEVQLPPPMRSATSSQNASGTPPPAHSANADVER
jgi:tetratricopeptide (TPR) repeat protein